jgi:hypothetical protein
MAKKVKKLPFDVKAFLTTVDGGRTLSSYRDEEAIFAQGDPQMRCKARSSSPSFPRKARKLSLRSPASMKKFPQRGGRRCAATCGPERRVKAGGLFHLVPMAAARRHIAR